MNWYIKNFIFVVIKVVNGDGIWIMRVLKWDLGYYNNQIIVELFLDLILSELNMNSNVEKLYFLMLEKEV